LQLENLEQRLRGDKGLKKTEEIMRGAISGIKQVENRELYSIEQKGQNHKEPIFLKMD